MGRDRGGEESDYVGDLVEACPLVAVELSRSLVLCGVFFLCILSVMSIIPSQSRFPCLPKFIVYVSCPTFLPSSLLHRFLDRIIPSYVCHSPFPFQSKCTVDTSHYLHYCIVIFHFFVRPFSSSAVIIVNSHSPRSP